MKGTIRGKAGEETYWIDGVQVSKDQFDLAFPDAPAGGGRAGDSFHGWKPIVSEALAVHPDQVEEAREHSKAMGVPTEFLPDGRPILTSRSHRKSYLRAYHFHDRDGGYGD